MRLSRDDPKDSFVIHPLNEIVTDAANICREKFISHGVDFRIELPEDVLEITCRPAEVGQIILNLLSNSFDAVKDSPRPWIKIKMSKQAAMAIISVSDSGPGIPLSLRARILEPFFNTKPYGQGTGLGLSISRAIANKHHGRLYLDEQSLTTLFIVELPIVTR